MHFEMLLTKQFHYQLRKRMILFLLENASAHKIQVSGDGECPRVVSDISFLTLLKKSSPQLSELYILWIYYRRLHLQYAVHRDERGDVNIYKVGQLTALK